LQRTLYVATTHTHRGETLSGAPHQRGLFGIRRLDDWRHNLVNRVSSTSTYPTRLPHFGWRYTTTWAAFTSQRASYKHSSRLTNALLRDTEGHGLVRGMVGYSWVWDHNPGDRAGVVQIFSRLVLIRAPDTPAPLITRLRMGR